MAIVSLILMMGGLTLIGAWLIGAGLRGHPIPRRRVCSNCHYDLSGHELRPSACPECGRILDRIGAVRVLHRRWCAKRLGVGTALLLVAFSPTLLVLLPKVPPKPTPMRLRAWGAMARPITGGGGPSSAGPMVPELIPIGTTVDRPQPAARRRTSTPSAALIAPAPVGFKTAYVPVADLLGGPTRSDSAFAIGGYGRSLPLAGIPLMDVPVEPGTWERHRGALHDLPSGPDVDVAGWMRTRVPFYPASATSRDGSHISTLFRR